MHENPVSTTLELESSLLAGLETELRDGEFQQLLGRVFDLCHSAAEAPELELRFNQIPDLDSLVQRAGREIQRELCLGDRDMPGSTNVFIASQLFHVGGHTRNLAELTMSSRHRNLVILTDVFDNYSRGWFELGEVTSWLNASVVVLPKMPLLDKTRNLMKMISNLDARAIGILADHEDVVAYATCNELLTVPQVFLHHADHNPTLGATVAHYDHLDLTPGNKAMCEAAGHVTPEYLPMFAPRSFQEISAGSALNTATAGTFNKFATDGALNYADIVTAVLAATGAKHVHCGDIPADYLEVIHARLAERGVEPGRFVYLGNVANLQDALIRHEVAVYVASAPVGGGKTYVEVMGLGIPVLIYSGSDGLEDPIYRYNMQLFYGDHPRWSSVDELALLLDHLDVQGESSRSRRTYLQKYSEDEFHRVVSERF